MPLTKNDFILVEYTTKVKETGEVIDTTDAEIAKQHKVYNPDKVYEPALIIVGEGRYVEGFEEALLKSDVGTETTVEVLPEKAYGPRDPNKVKVFSLRELVRAGITPEPGKVIEIGGSLGTVRSVSGGRVLVDFNHPLAGKTLVFHFKVLKKIEDPIEKIQALLHRRIKKLPPEKFIVRRQDEGKTIVIEVPKEVITDREIPIIKALVAEEIFKYIEGVENVIYLDKFTKKKEAKPATSPESKES